MRLAYRTSTVNLENYGNLRSRTTVAQRAVLSNVSALHRADLCDRIVRATGFATSPRPSTSGSVSLDSASSVTDPGHDAVFGCHMLNSSTVQCRERRLGFRRGRGLRLGRRCREFRPPCQIHQLCPGRSLFSRLLSRLLSGLLSGLLFRHCPGLSLARPLARPPVRQTCWDWDCSRRTRSAAYFVLAGGDASFSCYRLDTFVYGRPGRDIRWGSHSRCGASDSEADVLGVSQRILSIVAAS